MHTPNPLDDLIVCRRCGRVADQGNDEYVEWEVIDGQNLCPGCVTGAEEQEIFDDYAEDYMFEEGNSDG